MDILLDAILEFVLTYVLYWPGKVVLRLVTLGRYPPSITAHHNEEFVAVIGFVSLFFAFLTIAHLW